VGAGLAMVGLIEQVADRGILEQAFIHAPGDIKTMRLQDLKMQPGYIF
jgi:hypothetical protein